MKLFAQFVSFLFHPVLLVALVPFLAVYEQTASRLTAAKWGVFTMLFIASGLAIFLIGRVLGLFSDYDLTRQEERGRFYALSMLIGLTYLLAALFLRGIFFHISIGAIGIIIGIPIFMWVNKLLKASIHSAIVSAFIFTITILFGTTIFFVTFWTVPLVGWSRFVLKRHTLKEIIIGGALGILITFLTVFIGKYIYSHPL